MKKTISRILYPASVLLFVIIFSVGCAVLRKTADIPVGTWDYAIMINPPDPLTGWLVFTREGDTYTGTINSEEGSLPLENLTIVDNNLNCSFFYEGMDIMMKGRFEGNALTGSITVDYSDFPMTATKRQE